MKGTDAVAIVVASVVLFGSPPVYSAESCDRVMVTLGAKERDVVSVNRPFIFPGAYTYNGRVNTLSLGYVVPTTQYSSGVFIVKSRHTILTTSNGSVSGNSIRVERRSYYSPCSHPKITGEIKEYGDDVAAERYIDYHFYGLRDSTPGERNLERAHADVGDRLIPSFWPLPAKTGCLNTRYNTISAQFLYDDQRHQQYYRRTATAYETLERQATLFSGALGRKSDYVAPPQYREYDVAKTEVIPYRRVPNKTACFRFMVDIPAKATTTEVMIVDADDAFANSGEPQKSVLINWPAVSPTSGYVASIQR